MEPQELTLTSAAENQPSEIDGLIQWANAMIHYMDIAFRAMPNEKLAEIAIGRHDQETMKRIVSILEEKGA